MKNTTISHNSTKATLGFVLKGYPRISETFISNEIKLLESEGFHIHIFSMRAPRESFTHESVRAIKAKVTYLPESMVFGLPALLWHTGKSLVRDPKRFATTARLWLSRCKGTEKLHTWVKHFMQGCYLSNKALDENMDIGHLHAHFAHTPSSVALYASHLLDVPFTFTAHAKDIYTQAPERLKLKLDHAQFVVTCTGYNKTHLDALGSSTPIHKIYHGIDISLFNPANGLPATHPPYTVMTVARFVEKKGLGFVAEALGILRKRGLDVRWLLVGDGKQSAKNKLKQQIADAGMDGYVTMTGTLTHTQVLEQYKNVHAFVLGCIEAKDGDRDGIPNVIAEAMALGVPVASTAVSGIPEMIDHEETGMLAAPGNAASLADALERLLTETALREKIIPAARTRVETIFDNKKLTAELGNIFAAGGVSRSENIPSASGRRA